MAKRKKQEDTTVSRHPLSLEEAIAALARAQEEYPQ